MRAYGLRPSEIEDIKKLLQKFFGDLQNIQVFLFGSRSKNLHKPFSDIDLTIKTKEKNIQQRINLFLEAWEQSKLPYKVDITPWNELFKEYLPQINKEKIPFWDPSEKQVHPWRICPYGKHWVKQHPRTKKNHLEDVDGHCRKNPLGKDRLTGDEIELISKSAQFNAVKNLPQAYNGNGKIPDANKYDQLIAGWCTYWNEIFRPDAPITADFIKALIESESTFNPKAKAENKKNIGKARGLIQLTEATLKILKDRKGEIKDHYIDLTKDELFEPSKNICAAIRWMFRKREILKKRLGRSPSWPDAVIEYKGLGPDLKKNGERSKKVLNDFLKIYERYTP